MIISPTRELFTICSDTEKPHSLKNEHINFDNVCYFSKEQEDMKKYGYIFQIRFVMVNSDFVYWSFTSLKERDQNFKNIIEVQK